MADDVRTEDALEEPSQDGDAQQASEAEASSSTSGKSTSKKRVSDEDVRKLQAIKDREVAEARRMAQTYQRQMAEMQRQMEQLQTRDMSDDEKTAYEIQKRDRHIQQLQEQMQQMSVQQARIGALQAMASELSSTFGVNVPVDAMQSDDPNFGPDDAWKAGLKYVKEHMEADKKAAAKDEKRAANKVDTGGGSRSPNTEVDKAIEDARKGGSRGLARLLTS